MTLRFPKHLRDRVEAAAKERDVTMTFIILQCLEYGIDRLTPASSIKWVE